MYVISYDISNDKLRGKVAKKLEGYGRRIQYSVFECEIKKKAFRKLYAELLTLMTGQEEEGSIRVYTLCESCRQKAATIGKSEGTGEAVPSPKISVIVI